MALTTDPRIGMELSGYRVERLLGRGGMSVVYLAEDLRLGRRVALKLLAPELAGDAHFRERFLRESRLAASIDHQNVIPVYEAGETDGLLFIAMRYVEGTDLKRLLAAGGRLEPGRAVSLLAQAAAALDEAHANGLVHRDVKPSNILVAAQRDGEHVYLADFGLTKQTASESGVTETGQFVGTADYVSPEQIAREPAGPASDQYALACVLYECLSGEAPYRSESVMGVLFAHANSLPPSVRERRSDLPEQIDQVVTRGMAKSPAERYDSCRELIAEAKQALGITGELPVFAPPVPLLRRREFVLGVGATAAAAAAAAAGLLLTRGGRKSAEPLVLRPRSLVRIDPETNEPVTVVPLASPPGSDAPLAVGAGAVWIGSRIDRTVSRIDPAGLVPTRAASTAGAPTAIAVGQEAAWVVSTSEGDGKLTEIDASSGRVLRVTSLGYADPVAVTAGFGAVWVAAHDIDGNALVRVDPATGGVVAAIPFEEGLGGVATGAGSVWLGEAGTTQVLQHPRGKVWRIDPARNEIVAAAEVPVSEEPSLRSVAFFEGAVWASQAGGRIYRVDPAVNRVVAAIPLSAGYVTAGAGGVWVVDPENVTLHRIDPATNEIAASIDLHPGKPIEGVFQWSPLSVAAGDEGVWVAIGG